MGVYVCMCVCVCACGVARGGVFVSVWVPVLHVSLSLCVFVCFLVYKEWKITPEFGLAVIKHNRQ